MVREQRGAPRIAPVPGFDYRVGGPSARSPAEFLLPVQSRWPTRTQRRRGRLSGRPLLDTRGQGSIAFRVFVDRDYRRARGRAALRPPDQMSARSTSLAARIK